MRTIAKGGKGMCTCSVSELERGPNVAIIGLISKVIGKGNMLSRYCKNLLFSALTKGVSPREAYYLP